MGLTAGMTKRKQYIVWVDGAKRAAHIVNPLSRLTELMCCQWDELEGEGFMTQCGDSTSKAKVTRKLIFRSVVSRRAN